MVDDAAITFAYARSLADGDGPVLQPGADPVEGFSNPAWLALLTLGRWLGLFDRGTVFGVPDYVLFPKALALLCCAGILLACHAAARTVSRRPGLVTFACGLLLAMIPSFVIWCFSGLENSLFALAVVWLAVVMFRAVADSRLLTTKVAMVTGGLVTLAVLTRPDGLIYLIAYPAVGYACLGRSVLRSGIRSVLLHAVTIAVPCGAYLAWRYLMFHRFVPNTAIAKSQGVPTPADLIRVTELAQYAGVLAVLAFLAVTVAAMTRSARLRSQLPALLIPLGLAVAALVILAPDWMQQLRFASPVWPLGVLTGALAMNQVLQHSGGRTRVVVSAMLAGVMVPSGVAFADASDDYRTTPNLPMCVVAERYGRSFNGYADILGVRNGSLLLPDLGGTALTSRLSLVDMAGLTERRIAEYQRAADRTGIRDYVLDEVKPTFIHTWGPWSQSLELPVDSRMQRDYVAIYTTPGKPHDGDWVRKDAIPSLAALESARAYAQETVFPVTEARWAAPLGECGPTLHTGQTPSTPELQK